MSYAKGMVPTAAVAPLLRRGLIADFGPEFQTPGAGDLPRILHKWENEQEWAEYNSVDRALARVNMVHVWREEEPDAYYMPNLATVSPAREKRCARRGCSNLVVPKTSRPKVYCSNACYKAEYEAERTGRQTVAGPGHKLRKMVCSKGHDLHGDNLREVPRGDGTMKRWCHQCKIERQRANRAKARERRLSRANG